MDTRRWSAPGWIFMAAAMLLASTAWLLAQGSQPNSDAPAQQLTGPSAAPPQSTVTTPPANTAPAAPKPGQSSSVTANPTSSGTQEEPVSCNSKEKPATAGGANITNRGGDNAQPKQWQPRGGDISFTILSFSPLAANAQVLVCFRWSGSQGEFIEKRPKSIELSSDLRTLSVSTIIPNELKNPPPRSQGVYWMDLIPMTDVRILVTDTERKNVFADVTTAIGVSELWMAWLLVIIAVGAGFILLDRFSKKRLQKTKIPGISDVHPILRILSTPNGYASLSQLQIMLWTFVVGASAVYVMALSGELIEITSGTLILLGITGASTIGSTVVSKNQDSKTSGTSDTPATPAEPPKPPTTPATGTVAADAVHADTDKASEQLATDAQKTPLKRSNDHDRPMWSDLIMNERDDLREVDVTRVQMLYFTFITAAFVLMKVFTTYVIPDIPNGFLTLMGISNAVYMGAKVARKTDDKTGKANS